MPSNWPSPSSALGEPDFREWSPRSTLLSSAWFDLKVSADKFELKILLKFLKVPEFFSDLLFRYRRESGRNVLPSVPSVRYSHEPDFFVPDEYVPPQDVRDVPAADLVNDYGLLGKTAVTVRPHQECT